jgi:tetratricopeptide (TPR) repeat protein/TolB-like protein
MVGLGVAQPRAASYDPADRSNARSKAVKVPATTSCTSLLMLRLRTLGGLSIERVGTPPLSLNGAAIQRRPLALLAYLASAGDTGRRRDELLLHLWPDSTPARARNVLKQTVYSLRRDTGVPDLVLVDRDRLSLNRAVVTTDVTELEAALNRGDIDAALEIHRGAFLDGFSLSDVPEFERWAHEERARIEARFDSARRRCGERARSPVGVDTTPQVPPRVPTRKRWSSQRRLAAVLTLASIAAVIQSARRTPRAATAGEVLDSNTVAVLPFDDASADTSVGFLANGMVHLLAVRLASDRPDGIRTIAPRAILGELERAHDTALASGGAIRVARKLGAGRVVHGGVVGTAAHLVLSAEMLEVPSGKRLARASVVGTADSLSVMIDRIAAALMLGADATDVSAERAVYTAAAETPLEAIRDYVEGQEAYRTGHYDDAVQHFDHALARDSTFALAAFGLSQSAGWAGAVLPVMQRGARLAWKYQNRLPQRVRLLLLSSVGGPDVFRTGYVPNAVVTTAIEQAADANPDDPEAWYRLGDHYLHHGATMGLASPFERAAAALRRASALDESFAPPVIHLVQLAARARDTAAVRRLAAQIQRHDSTSEAAEFVRWRAALSLGDSATLRALQSRFDRMQPGTLRLILLTAEWDAVGLDDADRALAALLRRAATADEHAVALLYAHSYALDRGRPADALRATDAIKANDLVPRWHLRVRVLDGLYGGGDTTAAAAAADSLRPFADAPLARDLRARSAQYDDIAVVAQWRLWHGDRAGAARAVERLTAGASPPDSLRRVTVNRIAAALIHAIAANSNGSRDFVAVDTLDRMIAENVGAPVEWPGLYPALVAARLFALNGKPERAVAAVRRRTTYFPETTYLKASFELEAALAAQLGDSATAAAVGRVRDALRGYADASSAERQAPR